jgi:hypothetical protein
VVAAASLENGVFEACTRRDEMRSFVSAPCPGAAERWPCDVAAIGASCALPSHSQGVTDLSLNAVAWISDDPTEPDKLSPQLAAVVVSLPVQIATVSTHRCAGPSVPLRRPLSRRGTGPPSPLSGR